ncbi:hypothetical protein GGI42DRAFT_320631 [Trichoderma sp. SZMC 28013]
MCRLRVTLVALHCHGPWAMVRPLFGSSPWAHMRCYSCRRCLCCSLMPLAAQLASWWPFFKGSASTLLSGRCCIGSLMSMPTHFRY